VTWRWKPGDAISRRLFEALRLEIRYDQTAYMANCEITLTGETIGIIARTSQERRQRQPAPHSAALAARRQKRARCRRANHPGYWCFDGHRASMRDAS
jgi:hypothetical protein